MNSYDSGLFENLGGKTQSNGLSLFSLLRWSCWGAPTRPLFGEIYDICGANMGCNPSGFLPVVTSGIAILFTSAVRLSTSVGQVCVFQNCGETKQTEKQKTQCGWFVIKIVPMDEAPSFFAFEPF